MAQYQESNDDVEEYNQVQPEKDLEDIQKDLDEYVDICKNIKDVNNEIKIFKERKVELEMQFSKFMQKNNLDQFSTVDGKTKIKLYESNTKVPLNKEYLKKNLKSSKLDEKTCQDILTAAFERPVAKISFKVKLASKK